MATNIDLLREGLKEYINSLSVHNKTLNEDFKGLSNIFAVVNQSYEGRAAEAFKNSWMTTAQWFDQYIDQTVLLIQLLEERVAWLEQDQ